MHLGELGRRRSTEAVGSRLIARGIANSDSVSLGLMVFERILEQTTQVREPQHEESQARG